MYATVIAMALVAAPSLAIGIWLTKWVAAWSMAGNALGALSRRELLASAVVGAALGIAACLVAPVRVTGPSLLSLAFIGTVSAPLAQVLMARARLMRKDNAEWSRALAWSNAQIAEGKFSLR